MRTPSTRIQSLNWRIILLSTSVFMALYLLFTSPSPPNGGISEPVPVDVKVSKGKGATGIGKAANNKWENRLDDQYPIEEPNLVLGAEYDSPFDAVPGRIRPVESEEKAIPMEGQVGGGDDEKDISGTEELKDVTEMGKSRTGGKEETAEMSKPESEDEATKVENNLDETPKSEPSSAKEKGPKISGPSESEKEPESKSNSSMHKKPGADSGKGKDTGAPGSSGEDLSKDKKPEADSSKEKDPQASQSEKEDFKSGSDEEKAPEIVSSEKENGNEEYKENSLNDTAKPKPKTPTDDYIAICIAMKNQANDLPEWLIHHYHHIGIRHFYIMDDGSDPPLSQIPSKDLGIPREHVHFEWQDQEHRGGGHSQQLAIYNRCIANYGQKHKWMAFLDGDEFLEMTAGNETLVEMLEQFEQDETIGALAVNWKMHTSSGLLTRPESTRKAFIDCIWDDEESNGLNSNNSHVKSIVRTGKAGRPTNPHIWALEESITVGETWDHVATEAFRFPITRNRIALHHYAGKSRQEYEEKMLRGNAMDDPKGEGFWNSLENLLPKVKCPEMAKYDP